MIDINKLEKSTCFRKICKQTQCCIDKYDLVSSKDIVLGLSGGKDSTLLTLVLNALGYNVYPVLFGFKNANNDIKHLQSDLEHIGIASETINIDTYFSQFSINKKEQINNLLNSIDNTIVPCTPCSQLRRMYIEEYAYKHDIKEIAYGHNKNDLITTMLKDYYVYTYYNCFGKYQEERFADFVYNNNPDFNKIKYLINQQLVGTMSIQLKNNQRQQCIIRPFSFVGENEILKCNSIANVTLVSKNCIVTRRSIKKTKREIVHEKTKELCCDKNISKVLLSLVLNCLDEFGISQYNPRETRKMMLPGFEE